MLASLQNRVHRLRDQRGIAGHLKFTGSGGLRRYQLRQLPSRRDDLLRQSLRLRLALLRGPLARDEPFKVDPVVLAPAVQEQTARHFRDAFLNLGCALL